MFKKELAQREQVKLKIGLTGPSGSGKTYSALMLAYGLCGDWSKVVVADTENRSSLYYAGEKTGPWQYVDFPSTLPGGYHPNNWIKLIDYVERDTDAEVLILDSISHEWQGTGGCLDLVSKMGDGFSSWKKVTPLHNSFIDKIRQSRLNIIATMRSVQEYVVELNEKGKNAPRKVGLKSNQREGTDYEFGVIFDINMDHYASSSKDRTGLFTERTVFQITPEIGKELAEWCKQGNAPASSPVYDPNIAGHKKMMFEVMKALEVNQSYMKELSDKAMQSEVRLDSLTSFILATMEHGSDDIPTT